MHDEPSPDTAADDEMAQAGLFVHLTDLHPIQVTEDELVRELARDPDEFHDRDRVERAIRELTQHGLAHRHGPFVIPSRAALAAGDIFDRL